MKLEYAIDFTLDEAKTIIEGIAKAVEELQMQITGFFGKLVEDAFKPENIANVGEFFNGLRLGLQEILKNHPDKFPDGVVEALNTFLKEEGVKEDGNKEDAEKTAA